jgi:DNA-binding winged helix-turn-helix (wHTH) protein
VKLRPKAFETLSYLVQNPNRLISKDELVEALWTDSFVTDNSLVKCLKDVREALNDQQHIVIKTVPRRGYIFAAEVSDTGRSDSRSVYAEQVEGIRIVIEDFEQNEPTSENESEKRELTPPVPSADRAPENSSRLIWSGSATLTAGLYPVVPRSRWLLRGRTTLASSRGRDPALDRESRFDEPDQYR